MILADKRKTADQAPKPKRFSCEGATIPVKTGNLLRNQKLARTPSSAMQLKFITER